MSLLYPDVESFKKSYPRLHVHLGLTLAGAVSAGAYSAGTICYLFQTLKNWNEEKDKNFNILYKAYQAENLNTIEDVRNWCLAVQDKAIIIPEFDQLVNMHEVVIDVISGASAGSLVAAIGFLSLGYEQQEIIATALNEKASHPTKELHQNLSNNVLYDSWVNLNTGRLNDENFDVLQELLKVEEENELTEPFALLNAQILKDVKQHQLERLFGKESDVTEDEQLYKRVEMPSFISPELKMFFSFTTLRGMPFAIKFKNKWGEESGIEKVPAHWMLMHSGMFKFKRKNNDGVEYDLDAFTRPSADLLIDCALASGAFPIGFPPRKITLQSTYIEQYVKDYTGLGDSKIIEFSTEASHIFELAAVDGGTLNNEPFTEANIILNTKCADLNREEEEKKSCILHLPALVMIDPFPNFESPEAKYDYPKSFADVVSGLIGALRGQAMVKDFRSLHPEKKESEKEKKADVFLGMIFPSRKDSVDDKKSLKPALATSALGGFGGFLSKDFRHHDFHLGMRNAESFFGKYFNMDGLVANAFPTQEGKNAFADLLCRNTLEINRPESQHTPIIPTAPTPMPEVHEAEGLEIAPAKPITIVRPPFPKISVNALLEYRNAIRRRIYFLLGRLLSPRHHKHTKVWGTGAIKTGQFALLICCGAFALGLLILLLRFLDIRVFLSLVVGGILLAGLLMEAVVQWMTSAIIRRIGDALDHVKQLKT